MKKPELVERQIRLPLDTTNRLEEMGAQGGLTGEQMLQAILILDLFQNGWIKLVTPNPKVDPAERKLAQERPKAPAKKPRR